MALKLWLLGRNELGSCGHGASPSSPGTGGRGASSLKLLLGSGRWARTTALLMAPELAGERGSQLLQELPCASACLCLESAGDPRSLLSAKGGEKKKGGGGKKKGVLI